MAKLGQVLLIENTSGLVMQVFELRTTIRASSDNIFTFYSIKTLRISSLWLYTQMLVHFRIICLPHVQVRLSTLRSRCRDLIERFITSAYKTVSLTYFSYNRYFNKSQVIIMLKWTYMAKHDSSKARLTRSTSDTTFISCRLIKSVLTKVYSKV